MYINFDATIDQTSFRMKGTVVIFRLTKMYWYIKECTMYI
jgi:hypothetical protein